MLARHILISAFTLMQGRMWLSRCHIVDGIERGGRRRVYHRVSSWRASAQGQRQRHSRSGRNRFVRKYLSERHADIHCGYIDIHFAVFLHP